MKAMLSSFINSVSALLRDEPAETTPLRLSLPATISSGIGAGPLPEVEDAITMSLFGGPSHTSLSWSTIYFAGEICDDRVLRDVVQSHEVLVIKRGGCSFSHKLRNIAAYRPSRTALKLVVVVSYEDDNGDSTSSAGDSSGQKENRAKSGPFLAAFHAESSLIRPHLEEPQMTASGIPRRHLVSMVMVGGGDETYELLRRATGIGIKKRYMMHSRGIPITNLYIL